MRRATLGGGGQCGPIRRWRPGVHQVDGCDRDHQRDGDRSRAAARTTYFASLLQ